MRFFQRSASRVCKYNAHTEGEGELQYFNDFILQLVKKRKKSCMSWEIMKNNLSKSNCTCRTIA